MRPPSLTNKSWLALVIGNSRWHWAGFRGNNLEDAWETGHLEKEAIEGLIAGGFDFKVWGDKGWKQPNWQTGSGNPPVWIACVVPKQQELWQSYPQAHFITLEEIPLRGTYPSLGIDRALALWGAGTQLGWPVLVIDAGTALTFTGGEHEGKLVGGAILPGLGLQLRSLQQGTAALPLVEVSLAASPPVRWALNTENAILSGVIYTLLAGIRDFIAAWWQKFPESAITLTGGDRVFLFNYLQALYPEIAARVTSDPYLIFWGMRALLSK
ncbi:MAG: pantothenate kinase [Oscillatoriaceae bacterium SKW80]|nr:pantothenate kinase [Oscillatoriaceae bacterium SKYG93]MCX8120748.1 pantothenate kinase [Oscillatoriaceae bacterium SKW80]MDW8452113.1 pantothenate kinase [Oscillatoriaceae cyanobacterium SKYGB_i_bin93]HIK27792.1 pantothenate kinase [Oscillatoriaceae cyanobacterium M7585_C2015_266]